MKRLTNIRRLLLKFKLTQNKAFILGLVALFLLPLTAFSQSKKELEEKRKKIIRDIQSTEKMIKKTAKTKEATYDRYLALQSQIESREALIQNLQEEIVAAEVGIERNQVVITSLSNDVGAILRTRRSGWR